MDFHDHIPIYDQLKRERPDLVAEGPELFYREKLVDLRLSFDQTGNRHYITAYNQAHAELSWLKLGKPYFKVFPNLLPMFMRTKLSVPGKYFHAPFGDFLIRLPKNHGCEELTVNGNELRTALITEASGDETMQTKGPIDFLHMFIVWLNFGETFEGTPFYLYQTMKFNGDETIEEAIELQRQNVDEETISYGLDIGDEKINNAMRLVVSTCFLATGADRIVEPDVLNRDLQRYVEAKRHEIPERVQQLHDRAQRRGKHGWTLGREIMMPAHSQSSDEYAASSGDHLEYQHQRGAHFHVYHYGPGKSKWKVEWIRQLTVRPDLPLPAVRKKRGYKAQ